MAPLKNISGCVSFFSKMSGLTPYLDRRLCHLIIDIFGTAQRPTSTGDLQHEYFKSFFNVSLSLKITNITWFYVVNAHFQVLFLIQGTFDMTLTRKVGCLM